MTTGWGGSFVNKNPNTQLNNNYGSPSKNNNMIPIRNQTKIGKYGNLNLISIIAIIVGILAATYGILFILHVTNKIHINLRIFPKTKDDKKK